MYYNTFQKTIIKNKLETILILIKQIKIDSLCLYDLLILQKFIIKTFFLFRLTPVKKSIMVKILESLYNFIESLIGKQLNIDFKVLDKKLDNSIFLLKMLSSKLYENNTSIVEMTDDKITIHDRYKHH
ncbi:hypothetical protein ELBI_1 [Anabaena phage Elbi]|nr:hypothetical protein ELBI_1 [Anabaena phage Elbi]